MSIKKLLVLGISILYAVLLSQLIFAGNTAYVYVRVADAPPRINSLQIKPELAYPDSAVLCEADIYDANMSSLQVEYEWLVNNAVVQESKDRILHASLQLGDEVSCRINAVDVYGHVSELQSSTIKILSHGFLQATGYAVMDFTDKNPKASGIAGLAILFSLVIVSAFLRRK
ncbi:hypothetical protein J4433_01785 [Candidatus Pacearchaeota archaeon]|nr:hypothetical protein [Candidatus Pacearchaeota archaeon]